MCGCFVIALGAFFPRVALVVLWLFTDAVGWAFPGNWILPLLGLIFLPFTTLTYVLLYWWLAAPAGALPVFAWFLVILAFVIDIGAYVGGARSRTSTAAA